MFSGTAQKEKLVVQAIRDFKGFMDGDTFIDNLNSRNLKKYIMMCNVVRIYLCNI